MIKSLYRSAACGMALISALARAEEKKPEPKKEVSKIVVVAPLAIAAGSTATVRVYGTRLADATELKFPDSRQAVTAAIKSKGKVDTPKGAEVPDEGDTRLDVELTVPADLPPGVMNIVAVTPQGTTEPHAVLVVNAASLAEEKEPNGGLRQAQELTAGKVLRGRIESAEDVDVFAIKVKSGQSIVAEVDAAKLGSPMDPLLTLYDAQAHVLAVNDDTPAAPAPTKPVADAADVKPLAPADRDAHLRFRCPADGTYYLSVVDANGRGGAAHVYLLRLKNDE